MMFFYKTVFYEILILVLIIDTVIDLKNKDDWAPKDHSIMWTKANKKEIYKLSDFLLDSIRIFKHTKNVGDVRNHLAVTIVFTTMIYLLRYLPIVFFSLLVLGLLRNIMIILFAFIKKKEKIIIMQGMEVDAGGSGLRILINLMKVPNYYSWVWIYSVLSYKKGKIDKEVAYLLVIRWVLNLPMWFINMVFRISIGIVEILKVNSGLRKNFKIKLIMLKKEVYSLIMGEIRNSYLEIYVFLKGNKIKISSREIELNGFGFNDALREAERCLDFRIVKTIMFRGRPHVVFLTWDWRMAFILTTSELVNVDKSFIKTGPLSSERLEQRFLFSSIDRRYLNIKDHVQTSHFANNKWWCFEDYAGTVLRINVMYLFGRSDFIIHQGKSDLALRVHGGVRNKHVLEGLEQHYKGGTGESMNDFLREKEACDGETRWSLRDEIFYRKNIEILRHVKEKGIYSDLKKNFDEFDFK